MDDYGGDVLPAQPADRPVIADPLAGRIGEEGVEWLLTQTIRVAQKSGVINEDSVKRVAVDTTVMEKNIAYPADARINERARDQLAALVAGVDLRQS